MCGIRTNGETWCWGGGWNGQLGSGSTNGGSSPSRVSTAEVFVQVAAGNEHSCAVTAAAAVFCWGANWNGQLGDGTTQNRNLPVRVPGVALVSITAGNRHSCGLTADGTAYCWGENNGGQLGDGSANNSRFSPVAVALNLKFSKIFAGNGVTCGTLITPAGKLYCWGGGGWGQLGIGATNSVSTPTAVNSSLSFTSVVFGQDFTCGLTSTGQTHCWGYTGAYTLGTGVTPNTAVSSPVRLANDMGFSSLMAGEQHACGVTAAKVTYCWGRNNNANLTAELIAPTSVTGSTVFRGSR